MKLPQNLKFVEYTGLIYVEHPEFQIAYTQLFGDNQNDLSDQCQFMIQQIKQQIQMQFGNSVNKPSDDFNYIVMKSEEFYRGFQNENNQVQEEEPIILPTKIQSSPLIELNPIRKN